MYISTYFYLISCIFIPIFIYISTYFYIFILISTYLLLFVHISTYIYHKSVVFYNRLPQKCGILLQFDTKVWARNVPQNGVQTNYVPQVPHVGYRWGTKTSLPQDGKYLIFLKNLSTLLFLVGLIYRWGKGLKTKND